MPIIWVTSLEPDELEDLEWVINTPALEWWMMGCEHPCPKEVWAAKEISGLNWATFEYALDSIFLKHGYTCEGSEETTAGIIEDDGINYSNSPGYGSIPDIDMW